MPAPKNQIPKEQIRFPIRKEQAIRLVLQRRHLNSAHNSADSTEGLLQNAFLEAPRLPASTQGTRLPEEGEKIVVTLESKLQETERRAKELEHILAERNRDLAEIEALLKARSANHGHADKRPLSFEEKIRLERLRSELERKEIAVQEQKKLLEERERFLTENEEKLFNKMQEQQERETQLEQIAEELSERENRLHGRPSNAQQLRNRGIKDEFKD